MGFKLGRFLAVGRRPVSRAAIAIVLVATVLIAGTRISPLKTASADGNGDQPIFVPYYARVGPFGPTIRNDEWVIVYFYYEDPESCVPADFNLLGFFGPAPANCQTPSTSGVGLPSDSGIPKQQSLTGNGAVSVWFIEPGAFDAAVADGDLFIGELEPIALKGLASQFHETLHPGGGAKRPAVIVSGSGLTESGQSFSFNAALTYFYVEYRFGKHAGGDQVNVSIR